MKPIELCQVAPESATTELTLPLTFLDLFWFKFSPVERLFFYSVPELDPTCFHDSVLPKLKHSLSLTLRHYLPLAGNLLWPPHSHKPILHYRPGDAVSLSVAESTADFHRLSGNQVRDTAESRPLAPDLPNSHAQASVISLQVTLFPNSGFCIGISAHHAVLDGKSTTLFMKSWAYICKDLVSGSKESHSHSYLPPELTPFFDRAAIESNPGGRGLDMVYLNMWIAATKGPSEVNPRSLEIRKEFKESRNLVTATFELTPADIEKLRNRVLKTEHSVLGSIRLSKFVVSSAYAFVQNLRSLVAVPSGDTQDQKGVAIGFPADYRGRLDPPVPENYIGNCVGSNIVELEERDLMGANGFAILAANMAEAIGELGKGVLREAGDRISNAFAVMTKSRSIGISGSIRFGVYGADFGWGRPEKVAIQSTERTGAISIAESRDGSGGVEIGVVLTKPQMQHFQSLFVNGLMA